MSVLLYLVAVAAVATAAPPSPVELQEQLNAAIATGAGSFTIPPGDYNFSNVGNFDIHNAHRLKVIADGVTMWFNGTHRPTTGVNITNCDTLFVRGLSINYPTMQVARFGIPGWLCLHFQTLTFGSRARVCLLMMRAAD